MISKLDKIPNYPCAPKILKECFVYIDDDFCIIKRLILDYKMPYYMLYRKEIKKTLFTKKNVEYWDDRVLKTELSKKEIMNHINEFKKSIESFNEECINR